MVALPAALEAPQLYKPLCSTLAIAMVMVLTYKFPPLGVGAESAAGRSDRAGGAMVPGLHVAVRLPDITACWAGADGPQEGHVMEINLLCTGTLPSKRGGGGGA